MKYSLLAGMLTAAFAMPVSAADLNQARQLINQGQARSAYQLLAPQADELAGASEFDYLLGVAAVDSGKADEAITALERLLAVNPNHNGARMELARAYYALGADELAKREFHQLQTLNPPPQAKQAIDQYLLAIQTRKQRANQPYLSGYWEANLGYDDNITAVTDDFGAATQQTYGGAFNPTGNSILREDSYFSLSGGMNYKHPSENWLFDFDLGANLKNYASYSAYNSLSAFASGGASWRNDGHVLRAGLSAVSSWQETEQAGFVTNDRTLLGISGQWRYDIGQTSQSSVQLQHNLLRYADVPVNNIDQTVLTLGWTQALGDSALLIANVFAGHDEAINALANGKDYSRNNYGLRFTGHWQVAPRLAAYLTSGLAQRVDEDAGPRAKDASQGKGKDLTTDLAVGASWQTAGPWSVRGQYSYSQTNSTFDLYDFRRNEISLSIRRDFR